MMNKDYEKFKTALIAGAPKMVEMPVINFDDNETRLQVALKATHDTLEKRLAIAKQVLDIATSEEEMQQYLKQERTSAEKYLKKLNHVINGGWS